ncbi:hypothetical protein BO79DRAFT_14053 [Aspergillus costaricaensis CBS 115574]|uniref:Uncharacterized protein n=1 Tax=Aspergillus costaricaensis CBS 115574 TaxID=1448317 RepID=A0ACD1IDZ2_9EURO|nr:hypothetical protein BO79DRAFT_14053 [Aspergillus costaricaensis CBS 115574]RAK88797.1 hypothetical protein BO79DRAFT_14053 [Aspergillus costaricaensis CBS 115574]
MVAMHRPRYTPFPLVKRKLCKAEYSKFFCFAQIFVIITTLLSSFIDGSRYLPSSGSF